MAEEDNTEDFQVVFVEPIAEQFKKWLNDRGLKLFKMPTREDDLDTYGITLKNE